MRTHVRLGGIVLIAAVLAGCTAAPRACTAIGSPSGIGVTIAADAADEVTGLELTACWDDTCRDAEVDLQPGSDSVDQGCDSDGPDAACSAKAVPNGTLVGFANVQDLPAESITVQAVVIKNGKEQPPLDATVTAEVTYPNGDHCPAGGNQAKIMIDASGIN